MENVVRTCSGTVLCIFFLFQSFFLFLSFGTLRGGLGVWICLIHDQCLSLSSSFSAVFSAWLFLCDIPARGPTTSDMNKENVHQSETERERWERFSNECSPSILKMLLFSSMFFNLYLPVEIRSPAFITVAMWEKTFTRVLQRMHNPYSVKMIEYNLLHDGSIVAVASLYTYREKVLQIFLSSHQYTCLAPKWHSHALFNCSYMMWFWNSNWYRVSKVCVCLTILLWTIGASVSGLLEGDWRASLD